MFLSPGYSYSSVNPIYRQSQTSVDFAQDWWRWFMDLPPPAAFTPSAAYRIAIGIAALVWIIGK